MSTEEWSVNRLAARAVALHGPGTPPERRELMEMLGLVAPDGHEVLPDDRYPIDIGRCDPGSVGERRLVTVQDPRADRSLIPVGLRDLPPVPVQVSTPNGRPRPACGTPGGPSAHGYRGEPVCQPCRDAYNALTRERRRLKKLQTPPVEQPTAPRPACGTLAGRSQHLRRHEKLCRACADRYNTHQRDLRARRQQKVVDPPPEARSA